MEEVKETKKSKANVDQCGKILADVFSAIPIEEKHEKLRVLIEEHDVGNDEGYEKNLKGLFVGIERKHNTLKRKLIKAMSPNVNEVCSDEEDTIHEEE